MIDNRGMHMGPGHVASATIGKAWDEALMEDAIRHGRVITIERFKLAPSPVRSYRVSWKWTYDYRVDGGANCQYGPGLTDLKEMLRRKFPKAKIIESWKAV